MPFFVVKKKMVLYHLILVVDCFGVIGRCDTEMLFKFTREIVD